MMKKVSLFFGFSGTVFFAKHFFLLHKRGNDGDDDDGGGVLVCVERRAVVYMQNEDGERDKLVCAVSFP